jgi:hypothetical protein
VQRIGDRGSGFGCGNMFGDDHVVGADHDLVLAMADENGLSGELGRQRVAASFEVHEAVKASLARDEIDEWIGGKQ